MTFDEVAPAHEATPLRQPQLQPPPAEDSAAYTVDDAVERLSMGRFQYYLIFLTGLAWTAESMEMMLLSFIKQPLQCEWRISDARAAVITTAVGLGMLTGAFFWGRVADRHGRKPAFLLCTLATFAFGVASALAPSYLSLLLWRGLVGFGVGGLPVSFSLLMEFLPVSRRGRWGMAISLFWALGAIFEAAVAMWVLPRFGWRALIVASSLPLLLVLLCSLPLLESPRWLASHGRAACAAVVLRRVAALHDAPLPAGRLAVGGERDTQGGEEGERDATRPLKGSTRDLFLPYVRDVTVKVVVLWFAAAFTYYGLVMLQPELLAMENAGTRCAYGTARHAARVATAGAGAGAGATEASAWCANRLTGADFVSALWGAVGELPGIVACLAVIDALGRRRVLALWFGTTALVFVLLTACSGRATETALFFVGRGVSAGAFQAVYLFTNELYPAAVRATAMGVCSGVARTGLMAAPLVAQLLVGVSMRAAMGAFCAVGAAAVAAALLVAVETNGRVMLSDVSQMVSLLKHGHAAV